MITKDQFEALQRGVPTRAYLLDSGRRVIVQCLCGWPGDNGEPGCEGWAMVPPEDAAGWNPELGRVTNWRAHDAHIERQPEG